MASLYRFPFVACEIFTCEVDIILKTLVEDDEVRLFPFLPFIFLLIECYFWSITCFEMAVLFAYTEWHWLDILTFICFLVFFSADAFPFLLLAT